jgi:hypothetical protein
MLGRLFEKLRGSSREAEDLALGTTRPGDFAEDPDIKPNPHDEEDQTDDEGRPRQ